MFLFAEVNDRHEVSKQFFTAFKIVYDYDDNFGTAPRRDYRPVKYGVGLSAPIFRGNDRVQSTNGFIFG